MKVSHAFIGLGVLASSFLFVPSTLATTYQREVDVEFTFNSILNVSITSEDDPTHADIEILDLIPGQSHDSNIVDVAITTNSVMGYTASATVGNAQNASTSMMHENGTNAFTSIATDASEASLATDNTWGYSTSIDNGSTWANFSGLPLYTTETPKILRTTSDPVNETLKFKINAKAATTQIAGDYTNVINFTVVANVPPRTIEDVMKSDPQKTLDTETGHYKLQDLDDDTCHLVDAFDDQIQLTDTRDHKDYWVAKLRDGNCWMTQNLDLDIDSTKTYTNENTDIGWNGFGYSNASWQPERSTIDATNGTIAWTSSYYDPYSWDIGDWYQTSQWFESSSCSLFETDPQYNCSQWFGRNPSQSMGTHGHLGNYYNWTAAVAMNDSSGYDSTNSFDDLSLSPTQSICPAGWRLPHTTYTSIYSLGDSDFWHLAWYYNDKSTSSDENFLKSPLYFVRGEYISSSSSLYVGNRGMYWSSETGAFAGDASPFSHYSNYISMGGSTTRNIALSVRCLTRTKTPYTITFNANGGTGTMETQNIRRDDTNNLSTNTFTRSGYIFNGWNTTADGLGDGYGDRDKYTVAKNNTDNGITLYAQWISDGDIPSTGAGITIQRAYELAYTEHHLGMYEETVKGNGIYTRVDSWGDPAEQYKGYDVRFAMQDIDLTYNGVKVCDLVTVIGDQYRALDIRDNKLYYISKLADGRCWMTQNLDTDLDSTKDFTNENTDIGWNGTSYSSATWRPSNSTVRSISNYPSGSSNTNVPQSLDLGDYYYDGGYTYDSCPITEGGCGHFGTNMYSSTMEHGHIGNYYNYPAALATNDTSQITISETDSSVCPKGWRLPQYIPSTSTYDIMNLYQSYGMYSPGNTGLLFTAPLYFVSGGAPIIYNLGGGNQGWYWYGSYGNSGTVAIILYHGTTPWAGGGQYSNGALSIRCTAR